MTTNKTKTSATAAPTATADPYGMTTKKTTATEKTTADPFGMTTKGQRQR
jgi:hypothetical protein